MAITIGREDALLATSIEALQRQQRPAARSSDIRSRRRMRIGIFTESYPPVVNGVTTSVMTLIEELERLGHLVFVFAPRFPGHKGDPANVVRFPSILTPFDRGYPLAVPFSHQLISSVARYNLDIIHSQSPFMLGLFAMMVARAEHKPLVATNHTLYTEYSHYVPVVPEDWTKRATSSMVRWYYERCDAVVAPSQMAANRLGEGYGIRRTVVKVVPTGIPIPCSLTEAEKQATRAKYGLPNDAIMLLYAGRIAKEKNLGMLLDAFELVVAPAHPNARLVLAGSGVDADAIQERIDESPILKTRAWMTGFIKRHALDPLYSSADLFVFPSLTETQGVVLGEALAAGTPVCAVDAAASPETVTAGVDGLLTANDPRSFGAAINTLVENCALRKEMAANARRLAEERTPEYMARAIMSIYRLAQKRVAMRRGPGDVIVNTALTRASLLRKRIFLAQQ